METETASRRNFVLVLTMELLTKLERPLRLTAIHVLARTDNGSVPHISVMEFVQSTERVTISPLMRKGSTLMETVNTLSFRTTVAILMAVAASEFSLRTFLVELKAPPAPRPSSSSWGPVSSYWQMGPLKLSEVLQKSSFLNRSAFWGIIWLLKSKVV